MKDTSRMTLGPAIRAARERKGWSLDELAAESGVEKATISKVENDRQEARLATIVALCRALGLSLDVLVGLAPKPKRKIAPLRRLLEDALERLNQIED